MRSGEVIMHAYKLTIAYDGTNYAGWQVQNTGLGIQEVIQKPLSQLLKGKTDLTGSGRTDAGVHALGQTAHFHTEKPLDIFRFHYALNSLLPNDIRIVEMEEISLDFHARYKTTGKIYVYNLRLTPVQNPLRRLYSWHVRTPNFSLPLMQEAANKLIGTHDFKGFASESHSGVASYDSIRTMKRVDIVVGDETTITFEADGFLYKMVRNLVGTLVDIGRGQLPPDTIERVLNEKDRRLAGQAAPAQGLFLQQVLY